MQKKILGILLAIVAIITLSFVASAAEVVEIGTAEELVALMNEGDAWVAAAEDATDEEKAAAEAAKTPSLEKLALSYKLTADIDLTGIEGQSPIGRREIPFTGTFDGDGHTIKGINIDGSNGEFKETALFGGTVGATFLNLTVEGSIKSNGNNVAGIAGRAILPLTIKNCVNKATVEMSVMGAMIGVGGIVGSCVLGEDYSPVLTVENCVNYAAVKSSSNKSAYAGGIVGYIQARKGVEAPYFITVTVTDCVNYAPVTAEFATVGGGIVAYADFAGAGISGSFTLENCANFGNIKAMSYNGGVLGAVGGDAGNTNMIFNINNLYNEGDVSGTSDEANNSGAVIGLVRVPAVVDGVEPVHISNLMDNSTGILSVIGAAVGKAVTEENPDKAVLNVSGIYSANGTSIITYRNVTSGPIEDLTNIYVNVSNSAVSTSDDAAFAALAANGSEWATVDAKPTLASFTELAATAKDVEVIEIQANLPNIVIPTLPSKEETPAVVTTAEVVDEAPVEKGNAPVGLIIGIVAAVVVIAVVVVVITKGQKK